MSNIVYYILCAVLTAGILLGIFFMSKVKSAVAGNGLSALCTAAAILLTLYKYEMLAGWMLWLALVLGSALGLAVAARAKMIQMPQIVALLNGLGGAASALVAAASLWDAPMDTFARVSAGLALAVGLLTFTGSLVAAGKLQGVLNARPMVLPGHGGILAVLIIASLGAVILMIPFAGGTGLFVVGADCLAASALLGLAIALRVGGADMPITISLLNSFSGVAGAIAGMAVNEPLLVAVGGVVGASGLLLTQAMCRAMNRSLVGILLGRTAAAPAAAREAVSGPAGESEGPGQAGMNDESTAQAEETFPGGKESPLETAAGRLTASEKVIIIPGYGMAVAQAQGLVKQLADRLMAQGKEVEFAIHPVAGRMPGHMNVLLAEVDVPYENLLEMDEVNPCFPQCDVAVVVGANDVVNPAANTAEGTPIYGMPVLDAEKARHVVVCNFDEKPGYAGVANPLYQMTCTTLLLGDAKESLTALLGVLG